MGWYFLFIAILVDLLTNRSQIIQRQDVKRIHAFHVPREKRKRRKRNHTSLCWTRKVERHTLLFYLSSQFHTGTCPFLLQHFGGNHNKEERKILLGTKLNAGTCVVNINFAQFLLSPFLLSFSRNPSLVCLECVILHRINVFWVTWRFLTEFSK